MCFHDLKVDAYLYLAFACIFTADSESAEPGAIQDILTCGSCEKTFALADIVKFIQHKVLQCNKENYGQCFPQGLFTFRTLYSNPIFSTDKKKQPKLLLLLLSLYV